VWSIVRKSIRDHSLAEDAVQEIFVSLWKAAGRFDPSLGSESLFITTIARRRLIDRFRSKARRPETEQLDELVIAELDPGLESVDSRDEARPALAALAQLRPEQRKLLELWVVGGMTHSEIATSTGIPLGTIKSQIRRGLIRVRELIQTAEVREETA
jgi:RNA polymerase sigma factor (sigma-70 family)